MNFAFVFVPFILSILLGMLIIPYILLITFRKRLFDPLDARKDHKGIIPRLGGVSFVPIQACLLMITFVAIYKLNPAKLHSFPPEILSSFVLLICGLVLLFMVGIADDLIRVNFRWKFVAQIIAASFFPMSGLWINDLYGIAFITSIPAWIGMPLTVFMVVLIINAINLVDGIDGLASGLMAVASFTLGALFIYNHAWLHAIFAFITTGMLIPFFYFNVYGKSKKKRRIFMGDTGSMTLGYSIAFLALSYTMNDKDIKPFSEGAIVVAFSVILIPVLDVARVVLLRFRRGKPLFLPDRNHIHHKFLRMGLSHHTAMLSILCMALFFNPFNIIGVELISNNIILFSDLVLWTGLNLWFTHIERKQVGKLPLKEVFKQKTLHEYENNDYRRVRIRREPAYQISERTAERV